MPDNTITIVGNLTRDPELRFTTNGVPRALLGVAVNYRFNNRTTNEWEDRPSFFNVVCWRDLAQNVSDSLARGNRVVITGRLEQRSWETTEGEKRSVIEIIADEVAPSLRWATAELTRTSGQSGGQNFGGSQEEQPARQAGTSPAGSAGSAGGAGQSPDDFSQDEEPF